MRPKGVARERVGRVVKDAVCGFRNSCIGRIVQGKFPRLFTGWVWEAALHASEPSEAHLIGSGAVPQVRGNFLAELPRNVGLNDRLRSVSARIRNY